MKGEACTMQETKIDAVKRGEKGDETEKLVLNRSASNGSWGGKTAVGGADMYAPSSCSLNRSAAN